MGSLASRKKSAKSGPLGHQKNSRVLPVIHSESVRDIASPRDSDRHRLRNYHRDGAVDDIEELPGSTGPVIDRSYPLEDVVEATRYVETEQTTGNVNLTV